METFNIIKKFFVFIITTFTIFSMIPCPISFTETVTLEGIGTFDVGQVFSIEFYTDSNVLYTTSIPFTNMDPTKTFVQADARTSGDGKSDTGVVCTSNLGSPWYLKLHAEPTSSLTIDKTFYYFSQPWNRTKSSTADGTLSKSAGWYNLPSADTVIYSSGPSDLTNTPYGTLCMFSFALNPSNLASTKTYICRIVYTLTTTA